MQPSTWYLPLCHSNPIQGIPLTTVTTSHVIKGRLQIHNTVRYGRQVGFMGGLTSPKWYVCSTWPCSATFIQSSHQRVKPNKNFSSHIVLYTMLWHLKQIYPTSLDLFSPLYFAHTHTHNHTHTHTITHISEICSIITMNVLTFYQTTLFTACLISLITYMHTQHIACVDVLSENTLAYMPH